MVQKQLNPKDLEVVARCETRNLKTGLNFREAFKTASGIGVRMLSNKEADDLMVRRKVWKSFKPLAKACPIWTGTMVFTKSGRFGPTIRSHDSDNGDEWLLIVPPKYRNLAGVMLVAEPSSYELEPYKKGTAVHILNDNLTALILPTAEAAKVDGALCGDCCNWFKADRATALPTAEPAKSTSKDARRFFYGNAYPASQHKFHDGYIGALARGLVIDTEDSRTIADFELSYHFGLVVTSK